MKKQLYVSLCLVLVSNSRARRSGYVGQETQKLDVGGAELASVLQALWHNVGSFVCISFKSCATEFKDNNLAQVRQNSVKK